MFNTNLCKFMKKFDNFLRLLDVWKIKKLLLIMKFTALILLAATLQVSASVYSQTVTLSVNDASIKEVFRLINSQTGYLFFYRDALIRKAGAVNIEVENAPVEEVLNLCLKDLAVDYTIVENTIVLKPRKAKPVITAQEPEPLPIKVEGKVTDSSTNEPLSGVNVAVKGSGTGTSTDGSGNYSISVNQGSTLVFSFVGYESQEFAVGNSTTINVALKAEATQLKEVVVTALGRSKESKKIGFSTDQVKGSEIAATRQVNPVNSLMGRVAGVQIDQGAAGPFGSTRILIRGNSTLSRNNQPIFVVDGVIVENDVVTGGRDFGNDLENLNSEDFESVSILKGSAAAALYGSRAINGVILITTKKGIKTEGIGVDFSQSFMVYDPYKGPQFQNEFGGGTVGAFFTDTRDNNYLPSQRWTTKVFPTDPLTGEPYIDRQIGRELENWGPKFANQKVRNYDGTWTEYKAVPDNFLDAFQKGMLNTTNVAFQGATDKTTFRFSYSRNDQKGIIGNSGLMKNGFNLRATHELTKWLSADVSADYSTTDITNPQNLTGNDPFAGDNFGVAYMWVMPRNYDTRYWNQSSKYISEFGGTPKANNPLETNKIFVPEFWFNLYENQSAQENRSLRGRVSLNAKLTKWANLIVEANLNNIYGKYEYKELGEDVNFAGGSYTLSESRKENTFAKWMLTFNNIKLSNTINFNGFVGGEAQNTTRSYTSGSTSGGLLMPGNFFITNSINPPTVSGGISYNKKINSLYGSADLEYKNQLYLTATWRGDWSSSLTYANGTGNNFYNYPSASLAWIFSETFKLPKAISFAKLRVNIAALGKDTDPFVINPGYLFEGKAIGETGDPSQATFSSSSTLALNIKPERKVAEEIGLEMRLLKNRFGFDLTLYQDNTYNQILDISTPIESGVSGIKINAGDIQNRGIEFAVDGTPVKRDKFQWFSRLVFSKNKNMIISLAEGRSEYYLGGEAGATSAWAIVGESYGVIRSMYAAERYDNEADANDPKNGLPILNWRNDARAAFPKRSNTWKEIGDMNAKFRMGWSNDFTYKNWSLNVLLDAKIGGDMVLETYRAGTHSGVLPNTLLGRDAEHGGITWTSKYDGITYDDGLIVDGVFADGQQVTLPDGSQANVGGMTFKEAYDQGFVEPTHAPQFYYRYGSYSTGVADFYVFESTWVSLRQLALSYTFPKKISSKMKVSTIVVSLIGRDLFYLYNSLPFDYNPASYNSNQTSAVGEAGFLPMIRSIGGSIKISF
ncbi:MAG: SusC/RagA family TonB-linked outer membrane protein [Porphyromonadaceae bacterium]|nr:MAG: SusC/RagA family TonB-linked outer membrane protein [Porphyromonadaceae bacterium]